MLVDALLLYLHISSVLALAVFLTAKTSLTRLGAVDAAVITRLKRLDLWVWGCFAAVVGSGAAQLSWGIKDAGWLLANPLLWGKMVLLASMIAMSWPSSRRISAWVAQVAKEPGWSPDATEVRQERRWLMAQAHVMVLIPLLAVLLTHGFGR
jgi:putative membrane protein